VDVSPDGRFCLEDLIVHATGKTHPYELVLEDFDLFDGGFHMEAVRSRFGYDPAWRLPREERLATLNPMMRETGQA